MKKTRVTRATSRVSILESAADFSTLCRLVENSENLDGFDEFAGKDGGDDLGEVEEAPDFTDDDETAGEEAPETAGEDDGETIAITIPGTDMTLNLPKADAQALADQITASVSGEAPAGEEEDDDDLFGDDDDDDFDGEEGEAPAGEEDGVEVEEEPTSDEDEETVVTSVSRNGAPTSTVKTPDFKGKNKSTVDNDINGDVANGHGDAATRSQAPTSTVHTPNVTRSGRVNSRMEAGKRLHNVGK